MKVSDNLIVISFTFNASIKRVWQALTMPNEMTQWYFNNIPDFKPEIGFKTQFLIRNEDRTFTHNWEVTEVNPLKKITYNWHFSEYTGDSSSTFELFENKDSITLKLTIKILNDFQEGIPEFKRESCINGWQYFIGQNLTDYLNKK